MFYSMGPFKEYRTSKLVIPVRSPGTYYKASKYLYTWHIIYNKYITRRKGVLVLERKKKTKTEKLWKKHWKRINKTLMNWNL